MTTNIEMHGTVRAAVLYAVLSALVATANGVGNGRPSAGPNTNGPSIWMVQLVDAPAASYDGTILGLKATRPAAGKRGAVRGCTELVSAGAARIRVRTRAVLCTA